LLAYREDPTFFAVAWAAPSNFPALRRARRGRRADGGSRRSSASPARAQDHVGGGTRLVALACRKAKELGYPHELWTTRLLARHTHEHGTMGGTACHANLAQGVQILDQQEVKPHRVRYWSIAILILWRRRLRLLCVYRRVKALKEAAAAAKEEPARKERIGADKISETPFTQIRGIGAARSNQAAILCRP
jgi:hypothetical protein